MPLPKRSTAAVAIGTLLAVGLVFWMTAIVIAPDALVAVSAKV